MRRYTSRNSLHTVSELNVTPLLDLAFVLLIIFMITTPLIENRTDLVVPTSSTANQPVDPSAVTIIEMNRNAEIEVDGEALSPEQLEARLAALKAEDPKVAVVVRPDRDLAIQKFIQVMDILKTVGIGKVGVMTREEEKTPTP
jgi:biopolymer transport protein ExbD